MHSKILAISTDKNYIANDKLLPSEDEIYEMNERIFDYATQEYSNEEALAKLASMFVKCVKEYAYYNSDDISIESDGNKIIISNRDIALVRILFGKAYDINEKAVEIMNGHDTLTSWEMNNNLRTIKDIIEGDKYGIYIYDLDECLLNTLEDYLLDILNNENKDYSLYILGSYDYHF